MSGTTEKPSKQALRFLWTESALTALYLTGVIAIFVGGVSYLQFYEVTSVRGEIAYILFPPASLVIVSSMIAVTFSGIVISPRTTSIGVASYSLMTIISSIMWPLSAAPFGAG